jgi:hypothetical protein
MRAYRAARRSASKRPVPFTYTYEEPVATYDEQGEPSGEEWVERKVLFECRGEVSSLMLSELADSADTEVSDPAGMALLRKFFAAAFGVRTKLMIDRETKEPVLGQDGEPMREPIKDDAYAQYAKFFKLHTEYGDDDLLMEIMQGLVEEFQARPTKPALPSSTGPETTGPVSKVVSFSRGSVEVVEGDVVEVGDLPGPAEQQASSSA